MEHDCHKIVARHFENHFTSRNRIIMETHETSFPLLGASSTTAQGSCFVPPPKRARIGNDSVIPMFHLAADMENQDIHPTTPHSWWRFREGRRSSFAQFMDQGCSPVKLDTAIDRGIFDSNPLVSRVQCYMEEARCPPPLPFPDSSAIGVTAKQEVMQETVEPPLYLSVDDVNHATTTIHDDQIERESDRKPCKNMIVRDDNQEVRLRSHQSESWIEKYEELLDYKLKNGDCLVPNQYHFNPSLAEWVKRQRYQFKLRCNGKHSNMSDERVAVLDKLDFCWNSHDAVWETRYAELKQYKSQFGDTNVPSNFKANPKLAIWIKRQRRQYNFLMEGKSSSLTPYRKEKLTELDFSWFGRKTKEAVSERKWW